MIMASYKICPFCGFIYPEKSVKEVDLSAVMYDTERHQAVSVKKISEMDLNELHDYYKIKKHKPAWLWRQLYFRGGKKLIEEFGISQHWKRGTIEKACQYVGGI